MLAKNKFWNFSIAAIAVLTSIIASSSPIQAKQTFVTAKADTEYTIIRFPGRYSPVYPSLGRYPLRYPPAGRHPSGSRILARQWEMQRQARYNRCVRQEHHLQRCEYILRERNPYI